MDSVTAFSDTFIFFAKMQAMYKSADAIIHQQNALKSSMKLPIEWKVFLVSESKDMKVRQ